MRSSIGFMRRVAAVVITSLLFAACGGGGGTGSAPATPAPTPTPTPNPNCKVLSSTGGSSTYTLTSSPSGVVVRRLDPASGCQYFAGVTSATDQPQTAPHAWNYVFGTATNPYTVQIAQTNNGPHTIFYNQSADSSGVVNVSSLQSIGRSVQGVRSTSNETRRGIRRFSGPGVVQTKLLVRYHGAQARIAATRVESAEGTSGVDVPAPDGELQRVVTVPAGTDAATFASRLRARGDVAAVFPIHKRFALSKPMVAVNDQHFNNVDQWYLFADGFPYAWSYTTGASATIAVIDTGVDLKNTDLSAKIVYQTGYRSANHDAQDTNGHGTNVAAIAVAVTNNLVGFAGAGYDVKLMAYNIFPDATPASDQQTADTGDEALAIKDAVARGADVINLSLGAAEDYGTSDGFDQGEHDAIEAAITAGVTVLAAAGNDADGGETGTSHTVLDYPAAYDGVIAVGASALRDNNSGQFAGSTEYVAPYSQYGPTLGLVAPGGDPPGTSDSSPLHWIWNYSTSTAAFAKDQCSTPTPATSCSAFFAGTSQATPQVGAAAALLIAIAGGHASLSPSRVAQLLENTADNINDPHQGHGRLNIYKALAALTGDTGAISTGPTPLGTSPTQLVAFAYNNSGQTKPNVLDANYPGGVPVDQNGNFRIADVPAAAGSYRVGVWYDANGDGVVDAGDQFGSAVTTCSSQQRCTIGTITLHTVSAGFTLP